MRLDYHSTKEYLRMECQGAGKGLVFHAKDTIPGPHTDGSTIHVFEPNGMWTDDQWDLWEYEVQHEIGHESPENCKPHWREVVEEKGVAMGTLLQYLYNLMSDHVQEHNRIGTYAGRDRILKKGRASFIAGRFFGENADTESTTREGAIVKAACVYDTGRRESWNEWLAGAGHTAADMLSGMDREIYNKLQAADIKIEDGQNEYDAYQLALDILDAVGEDSKKHEDANREASKAAKGTDSAESGESGKDGEPAPSGPAKEGDAATGVLGDEASSEAKGMMSHKHYNKPSEDSYAFGAGEHIEYDDSIRGMNADGFVPKPFREINLKINETPDMLRADSWRIESAKYDINKIQAGNVLAGQVKRLLISMKQLRWQHGHKRGHISGKNLWKARGPVYDDQVFKKRTSTIEIDTAVTILTDNSGSMAGDKFAHAAKAGLMLNEAMMKVGISVELLSFSENRSGPIHAVVKDFNERVSNEDILVDRYAQCSQWMNQNSDGESIMWAYNRLQKRREKRKVLIVLSDGSPAAFNGNRGAEYGYTHAVIKKIEESGKVEIYGIGIMDSNVKYLYKEHKVLENSSELEDMLLGLVKQKVLK